MRRLAEVENCGCRSSTIGRDVCKEVRPSVSGRQRPNGAGAVPDPNAKRTTVGSHVAVVTGVSPSLRVSDIRRAPRVCAACHAGAGDRTPSAGGGVEITCARVLSRPNAVMPTARDAHGPVAAVARPTLFAAVAVRSAPRARTLRPTARVPLPAIHPVVLNIHDRCGLEAVRDTRYELLAAGAADSRGGRGRRMLETVPASQVKICRKSLSTSFLFDVTLMH